MAWIDTHAAAIDAENQERIAGDALIEARKKLYAVLDRDWDNLPFDQAIYDSIAGLEAVKTAAFEAWKIAHAANNAARSAWLKTL